MDNLLSESIEMARKGREHWINISETYNVGDKGYVVLLPDCNKEINEISIEAINKLAENSNRIIVLTHDDMILGYKEFKHNVTVAEFDRNKAEELMKFYTLYQFTNKLIIVSLREPEGRYGEGLIGKKGITLKELIYIGIFGLKEA